MSKIKDEDRILRTREKQQVQGNSYISINFSEETMQSKMEWQDIFKLMKKNKQNYSQEYSTWQDYHSHLKE